MRWLAVAGYVLAGLLLFVVFVFLTLPTEAIGRRLVRQAELATGLRIRTVAVERLYPLGLRWQGVSIDQPGGQSNAGLANGGPGGQREWVNFSSVTVEPVLPSLLSRRRVVRVEAKRADGVIEGTVEMGQAPSEKKGPQWRVDLTRVDGVDLAMLQPFLSGVKALSGRLSGKLSYEWTAQEPMYGTGTLYVDIRQMAMSGTILRMAPVEEVRFDQATCGVSLADGRATISNCSGRGPLGQVGVSGTAQLRMPASQSVLSLRVELKWQGLSAGSGPLVATVTGPVGNPDVAMEGGLTLGSPGSN